MNSTQKGSKAAKLIRWITNGLLGFIILICAFVTATSLIAKSNRGIASFGGVSPMVVQSESMSGTFEKGDLIFIQVVKNETNRLDQRFVKDQTIVSFYYDIDNDAKLEIITHLFRGEKESESAAYPIYIFQGTYVKEGQTLAVQEVGADAIIGIYSGARISGAGHVFTFLQSSVGFLLCFVLPFFLFFLYYGYRLIVVILETKRESAQLSEADIVLEKQRLREEIKKELEEEIRSQNKEKKE